MNQARKRTGTKKVLSMILVLVMLLSLLSMAAFTLPASETGNSKDSYDYNIMFLDCGRKYYSVDSIKQIIDNASAAGFNYIQLAVGNDGLRFLLDDMSLTVNGTTYDSDAVKKAVQAGNLAYNRTHDAPAYSPTTNELTESEMNTIITYAKTKGMGAIPCVNTPGHMDAILGAANTLTGTNCSYNGSVRTIDVTNATAVAFTKALLQKYITYFAGKGCQLFNMGADEYANDKYDSGSMGFGNLQNSGNYRYYVNYVNDVAKMIKDAQMTPMAFNDGIYFNNNTSSGTFDTDIIICYWSNGWSSYSPMPASDLAAKGFKLVNTNGSYYWVLGKTDAQCDAAKAGGFDKTAFPGGTVSNPVGSMFCIWADYPGAETEASVISKTAATIAAFGKALPQIGIKSTSGTALTLNGSTELTVPGNAEATWSVDPAGVIELQVSGNADERSAITGTSVIAKAVGAGTAKVTATVDDKTTYTTTLTVTDPSTVDVTVAVNGTKTITVDGYYNGSYATEDTTIATASAVGTAAVDRTENEVTTIESGKQYLIVHKKSELVLNDSANENGILLGDKNSNTDQLWTIKKSESGTNEYTLLGADEKYITEIANGTATLGTSGANVLMKYSSSGYWDIYQVKKSTNWYGYTAYTSYYLNQYGGPSSTKAAGYSENGASDEGSQWKIYKVTPETKEQTNITFTGKSVGDTSVQIGDVTYKIHVVAEDLQNVTPLKLEYWITNAPIDSVTGADSESRDKVLKSETYKAYFTNIAAQADGVASPDGVDVTRIAPANTSHDNRTVYYWRCRMLDTTLANNSTSRTQQQTADGGDDETMSGVGFTKIRYYGSSWQVFTENNEWVTVDTDKNQLVAYYLENIKVSDEVDSFAADWGNRGDNSPGGWLDTNDYCTLSMQVVYEDATTNPTGTAAKDLKSKTIVYGYWSQNNGRGIGTVLLEGQEYEIYKVTSETGEATASFGGESGYDATVTNFTWDKNETTVWQGDPSSSVSIHNDATGFSREGANANLCWDENKEAILLRVYVRAKVTEDSLTVNYFDESDLSKPFYDYNISVKNGTEFDKGFARTDDGKLVNNTVTNIKNVQQTVQWDLSQLKQIDAQYRYSDYEFTRAERSADGKTVNLYYKFKSSKTFVVDFGLPMMIRPADMNANLGNEEVSLTEVDITQSTTYANISVDSNKNITYTLNKTINGKDNFGAAYSGTIPKYDESGKLIGTQEGTVKYSITVIPATSVYYEDSLAKFAPGTGKANGATWSIVDNDGNETADKSTSTYQTLTELHKMSADKVYGYDVAYANSTKLSMGSAHKVTVNADMVKGWTDSSAWPSATFTFNGTGFDIISLTDNTSGAIFVDVYAGKEATGTLVKQLTVNNYYGYKQVGNGKWVVDTGSSNALYQIPVMKVSGLDYGEYTAVIRVAYSKFFDTANKNQYSFWLDAIRVYDPMGKDIDTYKQDNEGYPQYIKLRDQLAKENGPVTTNNKLLFIDGADKAEIATYANYGPNNEVYLAKDQAIAFKVPKGTNIASIQIGAKAPNGSAAQMVVNKGKPEVIQSATEMYYKIGIDGGDFTITNTGTGILSLTNLKITYTASGKSVSLAPLTAADQENAVAQVRALFAAPAEPFQPDRFEASWGHTVRKGDTATLTVKTSEDVDSITVDGQTITTYDTKTERTGWGWWAKTVTYREFTYQVPAEETTDYTICAVNSDGVSSDPITATLTVRPSVRDWWHGIFDKWF